MMPTTLRRDRRHWQPMRLPRGQGPRWWNLGHRRARRVAIVLGSVWAVRGVVPIAATVRRAMMSPTTAWEG
jgi:hypothetical protein